MSEPLCHTIRVLVADSSPITSQLLAEAIQRDPRFEVLGFSSDPAEIARRIRDDCPDVLLISARLGDEAKRGLLLLAQLQTEGIALKAIVLFDARRPDVVVDAFRSGASGVFCRTTPFSMLCKCITAVREGQIWANSEELGFVLSALAASPRTETKESSCLSPLSNREREVVRCLVEGQTNQQIADVLGISRHTVKNYIFKIFDKLGISNRVELVFHVLSQAQGSGDVPPAVSTSSELREERKTQESRQALAKFGPSSRRFGTLGRALQDPQSQVKKLVGS